MTDALRSSAVEDALGERRRDDHPQVDHPRIVEVER